MKLIIKKLFSLHKWIYVHLLWRFFYDKKYLKGRWFDNGIASKGWEWAARDIHYRIHTLKHLSIKWPVSPNCDVSCNIEFDPDDLNNMNTFGCYFQAMNGKITIGKGTYIAPNVGIITANHDFGDLDHHLTGKDVIIGEKCWIGMNSVILPGVALGNQTIVGAGSIVTHSFEEGHCVIAGNPARIIRTLDVK